MRSIFCLRIGRFFAVDINGAALVVRLPGIGEACLCRDGLSAWSSWRELRETGEV